MVQTVDTFCCCWKKRVCGISNESINTPMDSFLLYFILRFFYNSFFLFLFLKKPRQFYLFQHTFPYTIHLFINDMTLIINDTFSQLRFLEFYCYLYMYIHQHTILEATSQFIGVHVSLETLTVAQHMLFTLQICTFTIRIILPGRFQNIKIHITLYYLAFLECKHWSITHL